MDIFKTEKRGLPMEVTDDMLELISGGSDNYAEIIPDQTGNIAASEAASDTMMPVGAITEA